MAPRLGNRAASVALVRPAGQRLSEIGDLLEARREQPSSVASGLVDALVDMGVETSFGVVGGAIAPVFFALADSVIDVMHCRHESGAAFAATEAYFASGRPSVVFTTTGPGLTNALTGIAAAKWEGAKLIVVSGATQVSQRGRWALQESSGYTLPGSGLYTTGAFFDFALTMEDVAELDEITRRLANGIARPGGFVAHISIPINVQTADVARERKRTRTSMLPPACGTESTAEYAAWLAAEPFVIWVGFGAREAAAEIKALAERTGAPVMCSPRAKGVFPENHPQFIGVTGFSGDASVREFMRRERPAHVLVLGSRLGELTSLWSPEMIPTKGFIHVDVDPSVPGTAYPTAQTFGVQAEIGAFVSDLLEVIPEKLQSRSAPQELSLEPELVLQSDGPVRPRVLMQAVQSVVVEKSNALVMLDSGNGTAWAVRCLRFNEPGRFRASIGYGSMGHGAAGVVGATVARGQKAVAIVGDGAMLMLNEVSTAVAYSIPAVWIVMNDSRYGMVEQGMRSIGFRPVETEIPATDFAAMARALGAAGVRVESENELEQALHFAITAATPVVVDVVIDPSSEAPFLRKL